MDRKPPWERSWFGARQRAKTFKIGWVGGKIPFSLTKDQAHQLWIRDRAETLKQPSLDRIDTTEGYEFGNCRFIEFNHNAGRSKFIVRDVKNTKLWRNGVKSQTVRIGTGLMMTIKKLASKEGRSIKGQIERLLVCALGIKADIEHGNKVSL